MPCIIRNILRQENQINADKSNFLIRKIKENQNFTTQIYSAKNGWSNCVRDKVSPLLLME